MHHTDFGYSAFSESNGSGIRYKNFLLKNKSPTTPIIEGNETSSKVKRYEPSSREESFS